jgi:Fic family protein
MMSFRDRRLDAMPIAPAAVWLIGDIMEARGRQELYTRQAPDVLKALRDLALVQSVESSNRIEGVTVAPDRLRPLVLGRAKPQDRSEEEVRGYREALDWIHREARTLPVTPATIRRLHALCQVGAADAGAWKRVNNEIVELAPDRQPRVRFTPVLANATPAAIDELCAGYGAVVSRGEVPVLIAIAAFVFDFLCIHPFRDGNGRVSRLLTTLLLYQHGFEVARYVSLDRLVEEERGRYYAVLEQSSARWHDGSHALEPWLIFFLGIVRSGCREFADRVGRVKAPRGAKGALVEHEIAAMPEAFTLVDLERRCPHVSRDMVRMVLKRLKGQGRLECLGRGPAAAWRRSGRWSAGKR